MATSGKQLSSLPQTTNIGGDNSILTWLGNGNAEQITKKDFFTGTPIAYRQPSTTYAAGQIAYHASLPTGWYLECTTAGISGSGDLTISSPAIGGTVSDGTVVWTISRAVGFFGGTINSPIVSIGSNGMVKPNNTGVLAFEGGDPWVGDSATLVLHGGSEGSLPGGFVLAARNANNQVNLVGVPYGDLAWNNNDLGGSAIVAKSLGVNGYIKYASGLILQWGAVATISTTEKNINYPIAFSTYGEVVAFGYACYVELRGSSTTGFTVKSNSSTGDNTSLRYIAIGY